MLVDSSGSMKPLARPDGDAVAFPGLAALAGLELDDARLGQHLAFDVAPAASACAASSAR